VEVGQSVIGSQESVFRRSFDSCESPFLFLVVFLSLDASKPCRDRLGVGVVLRT
jgi:hypothetical protein